MSTSGPRKEAQQSLPENSPNPRCLTMWQWPCSLLILPPHPSLDPRLSASFPLSPTVTCLGPSANVTPRAWIPHLTFSFFLDHLVEFASVGCPLKTRSSFLYCQKRGTWCFTHHILGKRNPWLGAATVFPGWSSVRGI